MKLTKTERQLISEASRHHQGLVGAEKFVGRGPEGGKVNYGKRRHNAVQSLIEKGLAELVERGRSLQTENGYGIDCYYIVVKIK